MELDVPPQEPAHSDFDEEESGDEGRGDNDDAFLWKAALESGHLETLGSRHHRHIGGTSSSSSSPDANFLVRRRYVGLHMPKYQRQMTIRRILAEKHTSETVTELKQKLSMMFMMTIDCRDMIQKRKQRASSHCSRIKALPVFIGASVLLLFVCLYSRIFW